MQDYDQHHDLIAADLSELDPGIAKDRTAVVTSVQRGEFLKPCPGTTGRYLCCGYVILTPVTGCGMHCNYCILQTYFDRRCQVVFSNFEDLEAEVRRKLATETGLARIGTGEFADSLFLEERVGMCGRIAGLLSTYPNVVVEFKTKSTRFGALGGIRDPSRVVIGFSMNTERMIALHEQDTASLEERLDAARRCEEMGFWVAFHFDPMFWYPQWEPEYRDVVRRIFRAIGDPERIAWWSLGGFRTVPALKALLRREGRHHALFSGELHPGTDGKLRYFRPIRSAFYRAVREEVDCHHPATTLYLCMESPEVWTTSGLIDRIPEGLPAYLDARAAVMLGITSKGPP